MYYMLYDAGPCFFKVVGAFEKSLKDHIICILYLDTPGRVTAPSPWDSINFNNHPQGGAQLQNQSGGDMRLLLYSVFVKRDKKGMLCACERRLQRQVRAQPCAILLRRSAVVVCFLPSISRARSAPTLYIHAAEHVCDIKHKRGSLHLHQPYISYILSL